MKLKYLILVAFVNIFYMTPLMIAVDKDKSEIVEYLLSCSKVDVNMVNISNYTLFNLICNHFFTFNF